MSSAALRRASNTRIVSLGRNLYFSSRGISSSAIRAQDAVNTEAAPTPLPTTGGEDDYTIPIRKYFIPQSPKQGRNQGRNSGRDHLAELKKSSTRLVQLQRELNNMFRASSGFVRRGAYSVTYDPKTPIEKNVDEVKVRDGAVWALKSRIPHIWLRDNCQCATCVHQETRQRLLNTFSIPKDISIKSATETDNSVAIEWSDGHKSNYPKSFLLKAASGSAQRSYIRQGVAKIDLWDASIAGNLPKVPFQEVEDTASEPENDSMLNSTLSNLRRFGFCYIENVPISPEATEALLRCIAFIRETHYGGFYDFTADLASKDTAYTNIALEAHTDTTYFSDPAGLQAFHLLSHTEGSGGESLLVDGFNAAQQLHREDRKAYEILATVNVHAHASGNEGISIMPYKGFPVLEHDQTTGKLLRVRWNSSDRAAIDLRLDVVNRWYDAARKFDMILKRKRNELWEQLKPGTVVVFDNWRVLHGRSAFTGKRRICGGYINRDDWISKFKVMHFGQERVLASLATS